MTQLLILGNGFDLKSELNSSFTDYYDGYVKKNSAEIEELRDDFNNQKSIVLNDNVTSNEVLTSFLEERTDVNYKLSNEKFTLIDYLMTIYQAGGFNWSDVEEIISTLLLINVSDIANIIWRRNNGTLQFLDKATEQDLINVFVAVIFSSSYIEFTTDKNIERITVSLVSRIKDQLDRFEKHFQEYLKTQVDGNDDYVSNANKLFKKIMSLGTNETSVEDTKISILNFNYTNPINYNPNINQENIHGDLNSNIIFGFDQNRIDDKNSYVRKFSKTYRIINNFRSGIPILSHDIKNVIFYGHSLSASDYSYFEAIFDFLQIYDSDVKLTFLYSQHGNKSADKIKDVYDETIDGLLRTYGESLLNPHGKSLTHKLLMEQRLVVKIV